MGFSIDPRHLSILPNQAQYLSHFRSFHQLLKKWAFYFDGVLAWTNLISNAASKLLGKLAKKSKLHLQNLYNI